MRVSKAPEERRAELLAAARLLFDRQGVDKTRVSDIVRQVGVAQGVFYYYFKSKEALVAEVVHTVEAELVAGVEALLQSDKPFPRRVAAFIDMYVGFLDGFLADGATDTRALHADFFDENQLVRGGRRVLVDGWRQLVLQGVHGGDIQLLYPDATAKALVYGLEALAFERIPERQVINAVVWQTLGMQP